MAWGRKTAIRKQLSPDVRSRAVVDRQACRERRPHHVDRPGGSWSPVPKGSSTSSPCSLSSGPPSARVQSCAYRKGHGSSVTPRSRRCFSPTGSRRRQRRPHFRLEGKRVLQVHPGGRQAPDRREDVGGAALPLGPIRGCRESPVSRANRECEARSQSRAPSNWRGVRRVREGYWGSVRPLQVGRGRRRVSVRRPGRRVPRRSTRARPLGIRPRTPAPILGVALLVRVPLG